MNEGKPTKEKWWSRPKTQEPAHEAGVDEAQGPAASPAASGDGDFELARPVVRQRPDDEGDYELRRPEAVEAEGSADGATRSDDAAVRSEGAVPVVTEPRSDGTAPAVADPRDAAVTEPTLPARPAVAAEAAVKPLHDPDPYSTPPYGEPGPWAPAPPVQHPAATPAQGVAIPGQPPLPGAPAPATHGTPPGPPPTGPAPMTQALAPMSPPVAQDASHTPPPTAQVPAQAPPPALQAPDRTALAPVAAGPLTAPASVAAGPLTAPTPGAVAPPAAPAPGQVPQPAAAPAPAPGPAPAPDPWQRYDPWAAHSAPGGGGPLQQNGAAVLSTGQRPKRGRKALVPGAVLLALVSGGIGGVVGTYLERNGGVGTVELPQAGKEAAARDADSVAGIAGRALPSVVTLHVSGSSEQGTGTGFVLDDRGHILTNNHVVKPAGSSGEITVTFNSGETARAEVVGRDGGYDLAVVKVKGVSGLTPLPLGNSDNVQVGDPVVAIGAPFDLAGTVTSGIISAKQRPITAGGEKGDGSDVSYVDALQTDAPINPGNSGGPLLDAEARVIGINSAIRSAGSGSDPDSGQSGSIGLGFAIPINQGKRVAEELINTGEATHPVIGITLDMGYTGDGARVGTKGGDGGPPVTTGGPGAKAGIKAGDVITAVDGQRVHSGEELIVKTRAHRPGDRLELTVERGGEERTVSLVLGSSGG
ncbi:trypsin-like peptidase domain-containing protein [Streptomyces sp. NPDC058766]|uniref:trypsin-like peptidase domain-containing protein n=1 Tax=Streptomyces sp. NPDC058766 TaxID=3346630 RepID=UPI00369E0E9B